MALGLGKMDFERLVGREDCNMTEAQKKTVLLKWNKEVMRMLVGFKGFIICPGIRFCRLKGGC